MTKFHSGPRAAAKAEAAKVNATIREVEAVIKEVKEAANEQMASKFKSGLTNTGKVSAKVGLTALKGAGKLTCFAWNGAFKAVTTTLNIVQAAPNFAASVAVQAAKGVKAEYDNA